MYYFLHVCVLSQFSRVQLCVTPWTIATRFLCPWDFPGKNTGVGCHFLLQGIFPTQGSNSYLLHWQVGSLLLSHDGSPCVANYIFIDSKEVLVKACNE